MSKQWGDVTPEERKDVLQKVSDAIKEQGVADVCTLKSLDQFVGNLAAGEMMSQCHLIVKGSFSADKKALIAPLKEAITAAAGEVAVKCELSASIAQGDPMGTIENQTPMGGEDMMNVTHTEGQVILLDFWATWCPPCQAPMAHNQKMLVDNKEKWGDKVRIIGLSIDTDKEKLANHVKDKAWIDVEHYWSRNGVSTADKDYGVQGVPHCLLVDTHGVVVFIGHPSNRKFEEDINNLLAGEKLTGKGTTRDGGDGEGSIEEITDEKYASLTTIFKDGCKAICEDSAVKENAAKLQRAFLVLVVNATIDPETLKMSGDMQCITQLSGNPEAAAEIQKHTKPIAETEGWLNKEMVRE